MAAAEKPVTQHLDLWTTAIKRKSTAGRGSSSKVELYGIKKLRELILELAVRGLLVPQDPMDEPASDLLKRIAAEKANLVKEGKIKKEKPLPPISDQDLQISLPNGWGLARLGTFVSIVRGITFPASEKNSEPGPGLVACLRTANVQAEIDWKDLLYIDESFIRRDDQFLQTGDIVMSMANSRDLVGKVSYTDLIPVERATFGGFLGVIRPYQLSANYLMCVLRAPHTRMSLIDSASQTTNIANISSEKLNPLVIALPPLAEQNRIVAKVNELIALCDQLEQQTDASLGAHQTLVATLLNALTSAADHAQFASSWQRIAEHFDTLFTTEESIDQLKQTFLQLAVIGKLVPQDPNDEPAHVTYSRTLELPAGYQRTNKQKIKGDVGVAKIDLPSLPNKWTRRTVDQLYASKHFLDYEDGNHGSFYPRASDFTEDGVVFLTAAQISVNNEIDWGQCQRLNPEYAKKLTKGWSKSGDVYFTHNATVGRTAIAANPPQGEFLLGTSVTLYRINDNSIDSAYLRLYFSSLDWYRQAAAVMQQTTRNQVSITKQALFTVSLPPLTEQRRIAVKVGELNAVCDQLMARLIDARTTQLQLADALAKQALAEA